MNKASPRALISAFACFESLCTLDFTVCMFQESATPLTPMQAADSKERLQRVSRRFVLLVLDLAWLKDSAGSSDSASTASCPTGMGFTLT